MFDPNPQSIAFHLKDLEEQAQPRLRDCRSADRKVPATIGVVSVVAVIVAAVRFIPWA